MPSLINGFEYDIFISYRHKDNKYDGWVTEFVANLKREIGATFKEDINIYFDSNPYDGLLETHSVDKSLQEKLKSIVFIPIISQTYCDIKSFAWSQEFCVFNKLAKEDSFGRDIRLSNGNVASRILPVKIHDLDAEDHALLEQELDGPLRAIEFIFKSAGVNRPLRSEDKREDNLSKLLYRDQINKVANAAKEITQGIRFPERKTSAGAVQPKAIQSNELDNHKEKSQSTSIAVLPFINLDQDHAQEYFADGLTENIRVQLGVLGNLRVISRTSALRYKQTTKSAPEIAAELGVKYLLEGSAQSQGTTIRIHAGLVDAEKDHPIWSKVFVESKEDIFAIQKNVSEAIVTALQTTLSPVKNVTTSPPPIINAEADDLLMKGRHALSLWGVDGYRAATGYFKQAIAKAPDFREAYSHLASSYVARMSWNGDLAPGEARRNIERYLAEAWKRGPSDNDYLTRAYVEFFINRDFNEAEKLLLQAIEMNPRNTTSLYTYSYLLNMAGRKDEAVQWVNKAKAIEPLTIPYYYYQTICLYLLNRHDDALSNVLEALRLYPSVLRLHDFLARIYLTMERNEDAMEVILSALATSKVRPPSMVAWLAIAYASLKKEEQAKELIEELIERSETNEKGVNICLVYVFSVRGDQSSAKQWLENARQSNDVDLIWWQVDPLLKNVRAELVNK
jgi:TolB-like protein/Flp pilus assembly protein TadD